MCLVGKQTMEEKSTLETADEHLVNTWHLLLALGVPIADNLR